MQPCNSVLLQVLTHKYMLLQVETLAQQVADLQDQADAREDAHNERIEALQATIRRLSVENESDPKAEERLAELEAKCAALEEQVGGFSERMPVLTVSSAKEGMHLGRQHVRVRASDPAL